MPRKYEKFTENMPIDYFKQAGLELIEYGKSCEQIIQRLMKECGIPRTFYDTETIPFIVPIFDTLFNSFRGIKELSMDLRRTPQRLEELINTLDEMITMPAIKKLSEVPKGRNPELAFDCSTSLLGHTILNPKQLNKYYLPIIEKVSRCSC